MTKPDSCLTCPLAHIGKGFSEPEGQGTYGIAIIGESLGVEEYLDGGPFRPHAPAGSVLEASFRYTRLDRQGFRLHNLISCQPPGNKLSDTKYEYQAVAECRPNFEKAFENLNPHRNRVIIAAGGTPLKHLVGVSGKRTGITDLRGYPLASPYGWVIGMLHPAFLRRDAMHLLPLMKVDLDKAMRVAQGKWLDFPGAPGYREPIYNTTPSIDDVRSYYLKLAANSQLPISIDIETANTRDFDETEYEELANEDIRTIQFSSKVRTGMCVPYNSNYLELISKILALPNPKVGHNWWSFDEPRLRSLGHIIGGSMVHDTMWMFKHFQPALPRGLQSVASYGDFPFPWKHLFDKDLEWYGCADVDAPLQIISWLIPAMKRLGVWDGYFNHVYRLRGVLDKMEHRGIPVNEERRLALDYEFRQERETTKKVIQENIPEEVRKILPKRKDKETGEISYGYTREPKQVKEYKRRFLAIRDWLDKRGHEGLDNRMPFRKCVIKWSVRESELEARRNKKKKAFGLYMRNFDGEVRWCKIEEFNGSSSKQLIDYIRVKRGLLEKEIANRIANRAPKVECVDIEEIDHDEVSF